MFYEYIKTESNSSDNVDMTIPDYTTLYSDVKSTPGSSNIPDPLSPTSQAARDLQSVAILDGTFFKVVDESCSEDSVTAACEKCKPDIVMIKGFRRSSSNFISHLKRRHGPAAMQEYEQYKASKRSRGHSLRNQTDNRIYEKRIISLPEELDRAKRTKMQQTIHAPKECNTNFKTINEQEKFEENIVKFMVHSMIPVKTIENKYFLKLFKDLNIPWLDTSAINSNNLRDKINRLYEDTMNEIKKKLQEVSFVSTTVNVHFDEDRKFLAVTGHWITENLERGYAVLACRSFKKLHSIQIAELLDNIYTEFGISNKVVGTTASTKGNLLSTIKDFGLSEQIYKSEEYDYTEGETENDESTFLDDLSLYLICAIYTLNQCAYHDINKILLFHPDIQYMHQQVMKKSANLWKAIMKPQAAAIAENILGFTLTPPITTQFNSLYTSLQQILSVNDNSAYLFKSLSLKSPINDIEFEYLSEYLTCTKPLAQATDILQSKNNAYYGILLPCLLTLQQKLKNLLQYKWIHCGVIVQSLLRSVNSRFSDFFDFTTEISEKAILAALSHPKFKNKWFSCVDPSQHGNFQTKLKETVMNEIKLSSNFNDEDSSKSTQTSEDDFFDFGQTVENSDETISAKADIEIFQFFGDPGTDLIILNKYNHLKNIFIKYNTVLPSATAFESKNFLNCRDDILLQKDNTFEKRMFLKENLGAFKE